METDNARGSAHHTIRIQRIVEAPRDLVFRQWTAAEALRDWFAPDGYRITHCAVDARVGGPWRVTFESPTGEAHDEFGEFLQVVEPARLVFTLTQQDSRGRRGPETTVTVDFTRHGAGTEIAFEQTGYDSKAMRDGNAAGWHECLDKLARRLG
jgi:uncharacterized protein YndB with AHSA1/START domain